ncbi:MAG: hypothetical protein K2N94_15875 [Lachnospiraceae bacterium]|nr:hypothetical protein [Lachnospiraceae bacterium]
MIKAEIDRNIELVQVLLYLAGEQGRTYQCIHDGIPNFYNTDYAVINEYFVRAFQIRFMELNRAVFPDFNIEKEYEYQRKSFLFIDRFISALKAFETQNIDFSGFYTGVIGALLNVGISDANLFLQSPG